MCHFTKKFVKFVQCSCETTLWLNNSNLLRGVRVFHVNGFLNVHTLKQQIKINSGGSGIVSHVGTPAFNDHKKMLACWECVRVRCHKIEVTEQIIVSNVFLGLHCFEYRCGSSRTTGSHTSMTVSHKLNAEIPSKRERHLKRQFRLRCCCAKQLVVSCTTTK